MKIHDCLLVIGEITMSNRFLQEKNSELEQQVIALQEEVAMLRNGIEGGEDESSSNR